MVRPTVHDEEKVLDIARQVFLEYGPSASVALVAKNAGVSDALLFKRYKDKQGLFLAAMDIPAPQLDSLLADKSGKGVVKDNLEATLLELIEFFRAAVPRLMALWSHKNIPFIEQLHQQSPELPQRLSEPVSAYLSKEFNLGRTNQADSNLIARMIISVASNFVLWELVGLRDSSTNETEEYAKGMINILWHGLDPD